MSESDFHVTMFSSGGFMAGWVSLLGDLLNLNCGQDSPTPLEWATSLRPREIRLREGGGETETGWSRGAMRIPDDEVVWAPSWCHDSESWTANDLVRYPLATVDCGEQWSCCFVFTSIDGGVLNLLLTQNSIRFGRVKLVWSLSNLSSLSTYFTLSSMLYNKHIFLGPQPYNW